MVSDGAAQVFSGLLNAEVEAARLGQQGDADFTSLERRSESLHQLAATLEQRLGPDGWKKFNSFLALIRAYRSFCDKGSRVYTLGIILKSNEPITLWLTRTTMLAALFMFMLERDCGVLKTADHRGLTLELFRVHAAAVASLAIGTEDGSYQGNFEFGEFRGGEKTPRIYADQPN